MIDDALGLLLIPAIASVIFAPKFETFQMAIVSFSAVTFLNLIIAAIVINIFGIMLTV